MCLHRCAGLGRFWAVLLFVPGVLVTGNGIATEDPVVPGRELAHRILLLDSHVDLPYRLLRKWEDVAIEGSGEFDWSKAKAGGLDAVFAAVYVPAALGAEEAFRQAEKLIDLVDRLAESCPDRFVRADSPSEVEEASRNGKVALALGMENGTPVGESGEYLEHFVGRGIRYIGLAHSLSNFLADASYDETRLWQGLSPVGRRLVRRMNDMGVMVDVSHLSDAAAEQVLEVSRAPVIASHSSCRAFTPGWERNLSDELIRRIAETGGVVQVNFGRMFLNDEYRRKQEEINRRFRSYLKARRLEAGSAEARAHLDALRAEAQPPQVTVADVADHIEHIVSLVGIDHVGFGSDFEGLDGDLPVGLEDVSRYPALLDELVRRGFSEEDVAKIAGGNFLRVWRAVEAAGKH